METSKEHTDGQDIDTSNISEEIRDFIDAVVIAYRAGSETIDVTKLPEVNLKIRIQGQRWNGYVDKNIARFVLDAEKQIKEAMVDLGLDEKEIDDRNLVRLEIKNGSTEIVEALNQTLAQLRLMTPEQILSSAIAIMAVFGIRGLFSMVEKRRAIELKKLENEEKKAESEAEIQKVRLQKELVENIATITSGIANKEYEMEKPVRSLVKSLADTDTIAFTGGSPASKKEAKAQLAKTSRSRMERFYVDGPYDVVELRTPDAKDWSMLLKYGAETTFPAILKLDTVQMEELMSAYVPALDEGKAVTCQLQVTIEANMRGIQKAEIVGIGQQRESAISLGSAMRRASAEIEYEDN